MKRVLATKGQDLILVKPYIALCIGQKLELHIVPNKDPSPTFLPVLEGFVCCVEIRAF